MTPVIALTGAAGYTGRAVTAALSRQGVEVIALVRRARQAPQMLAAGAGRAVVVDLADLSSLTDALGGVAAVYHIPPNMHPAEDTLTAVVIDAAERAGVPRFVLHSVLAPYLPRMPHHLRKANSELTLRESGLTWTILQPGWYAQNLLPHAEQARDTGRIAVPYSVSAPFAPVDVHDVAEAAAVVLTESGHDFATYELSGPRLLDTREMGATLGEALGIPVVAVEQTLEEWRAGATSLPDSTADGLAAMFRYYDDHGLPGNPRVLAMLLGRAPTELSTVLARDLPGAP
ncbi:NAD(P)H-binding protein [Streptosporangium sp. NBC_01755]|uniref:SDR family oxidoreductase n=1 Tax=unclassified Streptosporangium TaxID=2632669 RepID=UPI002DD7A918|nr:MULTISPECIES: NAD(P)H-binding protein [unclassified Streptosporangium]WSA27915.1 NAD(P)H-binding protein [Streptosporangium sp. NBC_01810]WSD00613.1 NAD(P)H-binding protein [Streptosporangium sp. NBC_01755]